MSSLKRKVLGVDLSRRVRARRESSQELESIGTAPSINGNGAATDEELSDVVEENIEKDEVRILSLWVRVPKLMKYSPNPRNQRLLTVWLVYLLVLLPKPEPP